VRAGAAHVRCGIGRRPPHVPCGIGRLGGQCLSIGDYVAMPGPPDEATAAGGPLMLASLHNEPGSEATPPSPFLLASDGVASAADLNLASTQRALINSSR